MRAHSHFVLTALMTALLPTAAFGQQDRDDAIIAGTQNGQAELASAGRLRFALFGDAEIQSTTDVNGGGEFNVIRLNSGLNLGTQLSRDLKLNAGISYSRDFYDFDSPTGLAATDPWEDVDTIGIGAIFTYQMHEDWRLYTGPVFQFAAEDGADLTDGFTGGGVVGVAHDLTDDFTLGLGIGIISQIEDDAQVFPAIQLEWAFTDSLRLTSEAASGGRRSGLELVWDATRDWQFAVGASYEFNRFRLDDSGVAPDGVGEEERLPVHLRLTYATNNTTFNLYAGVVADGELRLEDDDGRGLADRSIDEPLFIALSVSHQF